MGKHAILSASSSHRWMNCPPSARLAEQYENKSSEYAAQGTDAHSLCEFKLHKLLGDNPKKPKLDYYDEEMEQCAESYATYIMEELAKVKETCKDPMVIIEQRLDFSKYVPDGFGTGDCLIIADGTLSVIDLKYGVGVNVSAEENPQMMCYSLGSIELFDGIYDINEVRMTIFQPRRENISTFTISKDELIKWGTEVLSPQAEIAFNGQGDFKCGSWCKFCLAKYDCRKRAEHNLELAKLEFKPADTLSDAEIEEVLSKIDDLVSWSNDVKEYALQQALKGKYWQTRKLVEGRSLRKFGDEDIVAEVAMAQGYPDVYKRSVKSVAEMEKYLGKKKFKEMLSDLVVKPKGKLTLVPLEDKRVAVTITNASDEFTEIKEETLNDKHN